MTRKAGKPVNYKDLMHDFTKFDFTENYSKKKKLRIATQLVVYFGWKPNKVEERIFKESKANKL